MPQFTRPFTRLPIAALIAVTAFSIPAFAAGTEDTAVESTASVASYADAEALIAQSDFKAARVILKDVTAAEPANADAWNLLGFSSRKLGDLKAASKAYAKALAINPGHLGALEYQGEMFIEMGDADNAKANLAKLQSLCGNCEELQDLQQALAAAGIS